MSAYSSTSSSDYNTVTEAQSPPLAIRRPNDMPLLPRDSLSPNPDAVLESPHPVATPVIITPVDRRSTRELVRTNRVRRRVRVPASRTILNTIRRRLSMATTGEIRTERATPSAGRNQKIEKTSTAIELESVNDFEQIMIAALQAEEKFADTVQVPLVPSESTTRAKIREQNRVESLAAATETLEMGEDACLADILDSIALLEANMRLMAAETEMIDQILEDHEEEKLEKEAKWARIEEILELMRD